MLKTYSLRDGRPAPDDSSAEQILYYSQPDDSEKEYVLTKFGINEHNFQSALDPNEISRLEFEEGYVSFIFKNPQSYILPDKLEFRAITIGLFYFENRIIIVTSEYIPLFEEKLYLHIKCLFDIILHLLYQSINHFIDHLKAISMITDELENKINKSMENENLLHMFTVSKSLVYYLNAIEANSALISKIRRSVGKLKMDEDQVDMLENIIIDNNQCYRQAEIYSSILSGLMDARGTIINNNMNVLFKQLTIINVIFLPLNLIASVGGMSEYSMMTRHMDWRISYTLFIIGMVIVGYITFQIIKVFEMRRSGNSRIPGGIKSLLRRK